MSKRYVRVVYFSTRDEESTDTYIYQDKLRTPLKEFDIVVVPTKYGETVAYVKETGADPSNHKYYSYNCSVRVVLEKIKSKTLSAKLKAEQAKVIEKKLELEVKKLDKVKRFEAYKKDSPEIAELLEQLKSLQ